MWSSYETCRGNATQDKRSGRRTAWATFDDFEKRNRTGHLSGGAPPKTGWADGGAHGRILTMAGGRRQGRPPRPGRWQLPQMLPEKLRRPAPGELGGFAIVHGLALLVDEGVLGVIAEQLQRLAGGLHGLFEAIDQ